MIAMIGAVARKAKTPIALVNFAIIPAANAPAKYVIEVQRKFVCHVFQTGSPALSATPNAISPEFAAYCIKPITLRAKRNATEKSSAVKTRIDPNNDLSVIPVAKVAQRNTAVLKAIKSFFLVIRSEERKASVPASITDASTP